MKKYTIKEFFESDKPLAIHTPTKKEAIKLCNAFDKAGYQWFPDKLSYMKDNYWDTHEENTTYSNHRTYSSAQYYIRKDYTILTMNNIVFEDDKEYSVKIEVKQDAEKYRLFINNVEIDHWGNKASLCGSTILCLWGIIDKEFLTDEQLQDYLLENHLVEESNEMTLKEIEEKLGIANIKIVEEK